MNIKTKGQQWGGRRELFFFSSTPTDCEDVHKYSVVNASVQLMYLEDLDNQKTLCNGRSEMSLEPAHLPAQRSCDPSSIMGQCQGSALPTGSIQQHTVFLKSLLYLWPYVALHKSTLWHSVTLDITCLRLTLSCFSSIEGFVLFIYLSVFSRKVF